MNTQTKQKFDMLLGLATYNHIIKGFGIVKNNADGWVFHKLDYNDLWTIMGNICGREDEIKEAFTETEWEFELKDGVYNFIAHLTYDSGQKCQETGRWETRPYFMVEHIEMEYHCSIEEWEALDLGTTSDISEEDTLSF